MTCWLSEPLESLLLENDFPFSSVDDQACFSLSVDTLIVGSGYGAALAALGLLEPDSDGNVPAAQVWVFERGHEYVPDDFPKTIGDLPGQVGTDTVNPSALWDIRMGENVVTMSARGLGGTSLVNANVAARPDQQVLQSWPLADNDAPWTERLPRHYQKLEQLLGVTRRVPGHHSPSFQALSATARAAGVIASEAPVAINFDGPTAHSADHGPCNLCGNCVTGCHSGAKGSLNMNAWPLVRQLGARLVTGVVVRSLSRDPAGEWLVHCISAARPEVGFRVTARTVVLGAGALGSTEILARSRQTGDLRVSGRLGKGFSTNGDALVFGIGQREVASMASDVPGRAPARSQPGPTISGMAVLDLPGLHGSVSRITVEDAVLPHALHEVWLELLTSQALLRKFADGGVSAWHQRHPAHDPLARARGLGEHSQALLVMGHDKGSGELLWRNDRLIPVWPAAPGASEYFARMDQFFRTHEKSLFDGGLYVQNPLSQPLPPGFEGVIEGVDNIPSSAVSVHPLGGCCMARSADCGVVNPRGQVFDSDSGKGVYESLFVVDGAIIPGAIGTNPFLTIAAVAYEIAQQIRARAQPGVCIGPQFPALSAPFRSIPAGGVRHIPAGDETKVEAEFHERMVLHLADGKRSMFPWSQAATTSAVQMAALLSGRLQNADAVSPDTRALVLDVTFNFAGEQSLEQWLEHPATPLPASATLSADPVGAILTTPDAHLTPLLSMAGQVRLGVIHRPGAVRHLVRTVAALRRYLRFRTQDVLERMLPLWLLKWVLPAKTFEMRYHGGSDSAVLRRRTVLVDVQAFWRIARIQAVHRQLHYRFESVTGVVIEGEKILGYDVRLPDLLSALLVLPTTVKAGSRHAKVAFELDIQRMSDGPSVLQMTRAPHLPAALMAAGGMTMYFLRMILATHFWSFSAPSYGQFSPREQQESTDRQGRFCEPPDVIYYGPAGALQSTRKEIYEQEPDDADAPTPLSRLVRYQPSAPGRQTQRTLLLVHGLAHSSRVFWTDTIACNFVQYFLAEDYDVWILDHRVSANYIREINAGHSWDDIAMEDIPWAVKTVFERINRNIPAESPRGVHVFSHCIGAGAVGMAVLAGKLSYKHTEPSGTLSHKSMLASLVPHAVTPWLTTSGENRARANLWTLFKELNPIQVIEPLPHRKPDALQLIYDRLAALAVNNEERQQWSWWRELRDWRGPGFARALYTRYTIFWGRQWHNSNVAAQTRYEFAGMIGPVPIGVIQQVYFSLTRGLLAGRNGGNPYVRERNFLKHWVFPTLFLHGNRNTVFDMESSRHSADQLTRLRIRQATGVWPQHRLKAAEYADQNVWIEVLQDYGHMDMIFSRTADRDVFPRLHEFFMAVDRDALSQQYASRIQAPGFNQYFDDWCRSNSHPTPPTQPLTGPIMSRPRRLTNGDAALTIWSEAEDFCALPVKSVKFDAGPRARIQSENYLGEFWRSDLVFNPEQTGPVSLQLDYGTGDHPGGRVLLNWSKYPWYRREFLAGQHLGQSHALTVLAGSCLYPGTAIDRRMSSAVFAGMLRHVQDDPQHARPGADCVLLLGDQIYADATADLFDPKVPYERFRHAYRRAFNSPEARQLMANVPVYMAVDDHEFRDNWRGHGYGTSDHFEYARQMAALFQMHHAEAWRRSEPLLCYNFERRGYPFFVLDTRFERETISQGRWSPLNATQRSLLAQWVAANRDSPVLIFASGSPLAPLSRDMVKHPAIAVYHDSLLSYPALLRELLELLSGQADNRQIIWFTGDPHFSFVAPLVLECGGSRLEIIQVCCSGLYAPMPFVNANVNDYEWGRDQSVQLSQDGGAVVTVTAHQILLSSLPQHFVRLDLIQNGMTSQTVAPVVCVQAFDHLGQPCSTQWRSDSASGRAIS